MARVRRAGLGVVPEPGRGKIGRISPVLGRQQNPESPPRIRQRKGCDMIEKGTLGKTGIEVSAIGLGAWALGDPFWGDQDERDALTTIRRALELGCTLYDTADIYGDGRSEELLGQVLPAYRSRVVASTKVGWK